MEQLETPSSQTQTNVDSPNPEALMAEFRERNAALDARLDKLLDSIQQIREDLRHDADMDLGLLSKAAEDMMNGRVYQQIDIQAKGELGIIVRTFNQTLANLQQLDASVKNQSIKVPELAAQLDAITADTEEATQGVMNRLDTLMTTADDAGRLLAEFQKSTESLRTDHENLLNRISAQLDRAKTGEVSTVVAQDILDCVQEFQMAPKHEPMDMEAGQSLIQTVSDEAFEILNILQFQDITRQKIEKVVQLLKQFRQSLDRLLAIFNITEETTDQEDDDAFGRRTVATQDNIFKTAVLPSADTDSVDDIVAQFKAHH